MNYRIDVIKGKTVAEVRKQIPCTNGVGFTHVPDGKEEITYEVTADVVMLEQMARKAARNTRRESIDGPIKVRVTSRRKL